MNLSLDRRDLGLLAGSLAVAFLAAAVGGAFTAPAIAGWYPELAKPWFTPPSWLFGPAWTVLYTMMGVSLFLVVRETRERRVLLPFAVQLVLNAGWSIAFFGLRSPAAGLAVIVLLIAAIAWTIRAFDRVSRRAALLLVPYLLWVLYATALNAGIYLLN